MYQFIRPNEPRKITDIAKMPIALLNSNEKQKINITGEYVSIEDKIKLHLR